MLSAIDGHFISAIFGQSPSAQAIRTLSNAIANASNGIPRLINKICNAALIIANSRNINIIDEEIIMSAVNDIELG